MYLKEFNQSGTNKIAKINKFLKKEFDMTISGFPKKEKLEKVIMVAENAISKCKQSTKKFQLNPDYAKFLGIKDVAQTMLAEGQYAQSPAYSKMKETLCASVQNLMDSGCTMDEAVSQCMNDYRKDSRWCYDDEHVLPIVIKAAKDYMDEGEVGTLGGAALGAMGAGALGTAIGGPIGGAIGSTAGKIGGAVVGGIAGDKLTDSVSENVLRGLAGECGVKLEDASSMDTIEEKLEAFAEVTGKSRDAVVRFLNNLDEDSLPTGIKFFGAKIAEANAFVKARKDAIKAGKKEFEVDGKVYKITGDTSDELEESNSMFDEIIAELLAEEIEGTTVEEAEVVMAVRALADDIQDQVERLGRMKNEDIPAIADQMKNEFGLDSAQQFQRQAEELLDATLVSAKAGKEGVDALVGQITGTGGGLTQPDAMAEPMPEPVDSIDDIAVDDNEPASAGPEDEPLGRAPVEV